MTDAFTDDLFVPDFVGAQTIIFPMSRLVLDPERFLNDDDEIMSALGMGVIYTRTSDGPWRRPRRNGSASLHGDDDGRHQIQKQGRRG